MIPSMPETAPRRSHTARELVTARVTKRTREFPQLFPNPLSTDGLDPRDVALANAIDQAVARRWLTLVAVIRSVVSRPWDRLEAQVQGSLLVGAAQILLLDRIPDHAAINDAVDWIKSRRPKAAGMVNAVLRRVAEMNPGLDTGTEENTPGVFFSRDEMPLHNGRVIKLRKPVFDEDPLKRLAEQTSHPVELLERWVERDGFDHTARLAIHGLVHPPIIITGVDLAHTLPAGQTHCSPHEEPGFVVFDGDRSQLIPLLAGHSSLRVQDPASAAPVAATADLVPNLIVELCAGKGTQTLQLAEVHPQALIIATDDNPRKRAILREVFDGHDRVKIIDPKQLLSHAGQADLVVVDVPCSNTAVLARRVEARYRCTPDTLGTLVDLQRQILVEAIRLRATDGHILYCTCSVEPQENQEQVQWLRKWHRAEARREDFLSPGGEPGGPPHGYRDGGYFAILRLP
jgi:16S rRNA (cytosine967-C5)-methyltransferase